MSLCECPSQCKCPSDFRKFLADVQPAVQSQKDPAISFVPSANGSSILPPQIYLLYKLISRKQMSGSCRPWDYDKVTSSFSNHYCVQARENLHPVSEDSLSCNGNWNNCRHLQWIRNAQTFAIYRTNCFLDWCWGYYPTKGMCKDHFIMLLPYDDLLYTSWGRHLTRSMTGIKQILWLSAFKSSIVRTGLQGSAKQKWGASCCSSKVFLYAVNLGSLCEIFMIVSNVLQKLGFHSIWAALKWFAAPGLSVQSTELPTGKENQS